MHTTYKELPSTVAESVDVAAEDRAVDWIVLTALLSTLRGRQQATITPQELRRQPEVSKLALKDGAVMGALLRLEAYGLLTKVARIGQLPAWRLVGEDLQRLNECRASRTRTSALVH